MIYLLYDGTFAGLLTAIYEAFYSPHPPERIMPRERYQKNLFSQKQLIITDEIKSDKVYQAIQKKISNVTLKNVYLAYLSELENIETVIFHYLKLGFKLGWRVERRLTSDWVKQIHQAGYKVSFESHRLKGLLRFRRLKNDLYYAPIEPDHNVLSLLAPHFSERLSDKNWMIHDQKRGLAAVFNRQEWSIMSIDEASSLEYSPDEELYQDLWRTFFETIAIREKTNLKLQRSFMPKRYWKHLIEKTD